MTWLCTAGGRRQLLQLAPVADAVHRAHAVHQQHAFQVVHLVLHDARREAVDVLLVRLAVLVLPGQPHAGGALHVHVDLGEREAAFLGDFLAPAFLDPRVDDGHGSGVVVPRAAGVQHQHLAGPAGLRRRQPHALLLVHDGEHLGHAAPELVVEDGLLRGALEQDGVGVDVQTHGGMIPRHGDARQGLRARPPARSGRCDSFSAMDVEKFMEKAEAALRKRAAPQAIALYRQVLRAVPGDARAWAGMLRAYKRKAELRGGPSLLDKTAAKGAAAAAAGMATAKKPGGVIKTCETGLERNPLDASMVAMLARALEQQEHGEAALAAWRYRLELDEGDTEALKSAGKLHYALRQIDEAVACLEQAHALDPHDPEVERLRKHLAAEGTLSSTRYETATSSRELVRDQEELQRTQRAERLHKTGDELSQDVDELTARVEADPADRGARRQLVAALLRAGDFDGAGAAVEAGRAADAADPGLADLAGDVALAANEAALRAARGDAEATTRLRGERARLEIDEYTRRVAADPSRGDLRLKLGRALYRLKETDRALEQFQAVVGDGRYKLDAQQGLGACFLRKGLLDLASRQWEAALEAAGGVGSDRGKEICYHLGLVCERQGDTSGALARYLEIYEVDINYKDVASKVEELKS
jgi:tetratricopeptide (TPR) repeat protein